ncbi:MAG: glycosyltransferase [Oceanospirillales bacterium]|nr:MAG: glycosyltransferase [Oceanospirillales bacterium]
MTQIATMQIIGSKKLGGAESFFVRLHEALVRSESMSSVAITPPTSELIESLIEPIATSSMRSVFDPFSRFGLSRLIKQYQPDIVQTWMGRATRLVHLNPSKGPVHVARLGGFYDPKQYQHAHALVGNTQSICDFLIQSGVPSSKVSFISNFVAVPEATPEEELQSIRQELQLPEDAVIIFSLGRLHHNKAFDTLINAFEQLARQYQDRPVHLLIAGDGPLKSELEHQVTVSSVANQIHWLGWQRNPTPYFHLADLFVCPSRHEPLGNVLLEAWAHDCPVVSTRSHGALELIEDGVSGLLCDVDDAQKMASQMLTVLEASEEQRQSLIDQGAKVLDLRFSERVILSSYQDLYEQLLKRSR